MDLKETQGMTIDEERRHWWVCTRFNYIDNALEQLENQEIRVLEFGCGTGQNLWYIRCRSLFSKACRYLIGVDTGLEEQEVKQDWMEKGDKLANRMPEISQKANCLLAMDVLEHVDEDQQVLTEWVKDLEQGGVALLTVPAFQHLWSYHDDFLDHKRRYTKKQLTELGKSCGLEPLKVSYAFSYLYPVVFLVRKLLPSNNEKKSDLTLPPSLVNGLLKIVGFVEAKLGGFPWFGTSVIGVFVKR